jgi:hypothetical protein
VSTYQSRTADPKYLAALDARVAAEDAEAIANAERNAAAGTSCKPCEMLRIDCTHDLEAGEATDDYAGDATTTTTDPLITRMTPDLLRAAVAFWYGDNGIITPYATYTRHASDGGSYTLAGPRISGRDGWGILYTDDRGLVIEFNDGASGRITSNADGTWTFAAYGDAQRFGTPRAEQDTTVPAARAEEDEGPEQEGDEVLDATVTVPLDLWARLVTEAGYVFPGGAIPTPADIAAMTEDEVTERQEAAADIARADCGAEVFVHNGLNLHTGSGMPEGVEGEVPMCPEHGEQRITITGARLVDGGVEQYWKLTCGCTRAYATIAR